MKLVDEWRHAWKWLSTWVFVLIGISPDLYSGIVAMGWLDDPALPPAFVWALRILAGLGIFVRLLKQWQVDHPKDPPA